MSISVITTVGGATANSYVSVASANEYFDRRNESEAWLKLIENSTGTLSATDKRGALLIQATREIDKTFRFFGSKDGSSIRGDAEYQNLEFPRADDVNADGDLIIPDEVKYAAFEQAIWIQQRAAVQTNQDGVVISQPKFSDLAYDYLKPWVTRAAVRVGRYSWQGSDY